MILGIALQFIVAIFVLKVPAAYLIFDTMGKIVTQFLDFTVKGAKFVFGEDYK